MTRTGSVAEKERQLRAEAAAIATELFRERGAGAVELLTDRMAKPGASAEERRRDRLARLEVERLDRERRNGTSNRSLVVWKPPLFSLAGFAGLFGIKLRPSRKRR